MLLDTIFERTRSGVLALSGNQPPLSGGFRQMLALIDGKRSGGDLLEGMPRLDEEDLALWVGELMRQNLIAPKDDVPVDEMAFNLTTEMSPGALNAVTADPRALIDNIMADVSKVLGPLIDAEVEKRLNTTTRRMAAIEASGSHDGLGRAGFFVYPNTADGLPRQPRVCIAGHLPAQNRVLELLFARAGIKAVVVQTRAALRAMLGGADKPHILLVDAEMPMLDAFRTLDAMRVDSGLKGVRMVLISSRGERGDLAQAMMLGVAAYIVKPLRKDVLDAALPQILGRAIS